MKIYFVSFVCFVSILCAAQNKFSQDELLSVNDRLISTKEFVNVFTKNASIIDKDDKLSVDEYFELFKTYHLKLEEAYTLGLDQDPVFLKEYNKYYKQLADNYIANGDVTEQMVKETYHRTTNEVKASHILISPDSNASTEDWENAFNKAWDIKEQLDGGADFDSLAKLHSKDPSVNSNAGNLGWFKAFKMVAPFEDATYSLALNEVSDPVQTQFGYHIIKKTGERESIGKIKVAHIMINLQQKDTTQQPEEKINQIYQRILNGEDFHDLAKQFSQENNTAEKGGEMNPFGIGDLNSPIFTDVVFSLNQDGDVSEPFKTRFGWHIAKRLGITPPSPYSEVKEELRRRIKTSERSKLLNERIQEKIKSFYTVNIDQEAVAYVKTIVDKDVFKGKWKLNQNQNIPDKVFLSIDETSYSWEELTQYIEKNQRGAKSKNSTDDLVTELSDTFVYAKLIDYHKQNLPDLDPEFAETIEEYKNGLLLFEVMQREVWNAAKEDSLGLKAYYTKNQSKYLTDEKIEAEIIGFSEKKKAKKFLKKIKKGADFGDSANASSEGLFQNKETYTKSSAAISSQLIFEEGISKVIQHNGQYLIYHIIEIMPVQQLAYEDIQGRVMADYQDQIEQNWLQTLREKYSITVNETELKQLKTKFEE